MKKLLTIITSIFVAFSATAQRIQLNIELVGDTAGVSKVYVQPMTVGSAVKPVTLRAKDGAYSGSMRPSAVGLYSLVVVKNQSQLSVAVSIPQSQTASLTVNVKDKLLEINNTPDNVVLSVLNAKINALDRHLWTCDSMTGDEMKSLVEGYVAAYESLAGIGSITGHVKEYMSVYAHARAYNAYSSIPRALKIAGTAIPFSRSEVLPSPVEAFDNDYAPMVYSVPMIIRSEFPSTRSLLDKMEYLHANYKNKAVREVVSASIMSDFLSKYNYSADYEGGLELVKNVTQRYSLPDIFVNEYVKRKSTIVGSPFPDSVTLVDADGNEVDFSTFRGKYVYIDMWASWCNPCCKEVPHLQKLEKELKNRNVVFVSISTDSDVKAWKNKMSELGMHGYQLLDSGNSLGNALNVKMIPFFVIYDKEGNLHTYGAMRPSSGERLKEVLEGLE